MARQRGGQAGGSGAPPWAEALGAATAQLGQQFGGLQQALEGVSRGLGAAAQQTQALAAATDTLRRNALAVGAAYVTARASLEGWVRAGLSGTTTGEALSWQTQQLSRSISAVFLPAVEAGIRGLRTITDFFHRLTGEQQEQVRRWSLFGVAVLGAAATIPRLVGGLGTLTQVFRGLALANPFTAAVAALAGLLSMSERGRESLGRIGQVAGEAFAPLASLFGDVLLPFLERFVEMLGQGAGQFLLITTVIGTATYRIIANFRAIAAAVTSLGGAIGLAVAVLGTLAVAFGKSDFDKSLQNIARQVAAGRTTLEQAREQVRQEARAQAEADREAVREDPFARATAGVRGLDLDRMQDELQKRLEREGLSRVERAARGRRDAVPSGGGQEDPLQTIRRLEQASIRSGVDPNERTARGVEDINDILRRWVGQAPRQDNRENPPKND